VIPGDVAAEDPGVALVAGRMLVPLGEL